MQEYTIALIKPDAVRRRLVGKILSRIEETGFEISVINVRKFTRLAAEDFYGRQHKGQPYFPALVDFMVEGPHMRLLLKREDAISEWRALMGPWKPSERAADGARDTIRGYFMEGAETMRNLVHGSDSTESVLHEMQALGWHAGVWGV